jgi:hypothetical protein
MQLAYGLKAFLFILLIIPIISSAEEFQCPSTIEISEKVGTVNPPWESIVSPQGYQLDRALLFFHHPAEGGSQVPDKTVKGKRILRDVWLFRGKKSEEFWIGCRYLNSNTLLVRPIGSGFEQCEASYETLPSGKVLKLNAIQCR